MGASARADRAGGPVGPEPLRVSAKGAHPLRVVDYINAAEPSAVVAFYARDYTRDDWCTTESFNRFKAAFNSRVGVNRGDGMRVILRHVEDKWSQHPGCGEDEEYIDVGGTDAEGAHWSLSFTPWGEWKLLTVEDVTGKNLTPDEIAAHLYYEITWHGWEEEGQEKLAGLLDQVEAIERGDVKIAPFRDSDGNL